MDKATLVSLDIERGEELVDILDRTGLRPDVALWMFSSEHEDWRLVISGRNFKADSSDAYRLLNDTLDGAGFALKKTPPVMILPRGDGFIRELRRVFSKAKSVHGMRLGGQMIGDRFVQDAYVYRIS